MAAELAMKSCSICNRSRPSHNLYFNQLYCKGCYIGKSKDQEGVNAELVKCLEEYNIDYKQLYVDYKQVCAKYDQLQTSFMSSVNAHVDTINGQKSIIIDQKATINMLREQHRIDEISITEVLKEARAMQNKDNKH